MARRKIETKYDLCETQVTIYSSGQPFQLDFVKSYRVEGQWIAREAPTKEECLNALSKRMDLLECGYQFRTINGQHVLTLPPNERNTATIGELHERKPFYRLSGLESPCVEDACFRCDDDNIDEVVWIW